LLRQEVDLFRELEGIQGQALQSVQAGSFANLDGLLTRQREVLSELEERRRTLQPLLQEWQALPESGREALRQGPIGNLLQDVEAAAGQIQKRHQDQFDGPEPASGEGDGGGDLGLRISRYRAGH
jgi:hypothetical protein